MTTISGLARIEPTRSQAMRMAGGFNLPAGAGPLVAPGAAPSVAGLLAMQEQGLDTVRDREARRHGRALLLALAEMQRELLAGGDGPGLQRLAALVRAAPPPDDPGLAGVQRALLVRAAVELARAPRGTAATG